MSKSPRPKYDTLARTMAVAHECNVRCIAEQTVKGNDSLLQFFATPKGVVIVQHWRTGGCAHYAERGGMWEDLVDDFRGDK